MVYNLNISQNKRYSH